MYTFYGRQFESIILIIERDNNTMSLIFLINGNYKNLETKNKDMIDNIIKHHPHEKIFFDEEADKFLNKVLGEGLQFLDELNDDAPEWTIMWGKRKLHRKPYKKVFSEFRQSLKVYIAKCNQKKKQIKNLKKENEKFWETIEDIYSK